MSALKQMTVEEVKQRFSLLIKCVDFEHIDRESYIEGVYQSLLAFCPVDSPALSALLILKIEFLSF